MVVLSPDDEPTQPTTLSSRTTRGARTATLSAHAHGAKAPGREGSARVTPLHRGSTGDALLARLRAALAHRGSITTDLTSDAVSPQAWQNTAERAAQELGCPVHTGRVGRAGTDLVTVWAVPLA